MYLFAEDGTKEAEEDVGKGDEICDKWAVTLDSCENLLHFEGGVGVLCAWCMLQCLESIAADYRHDEEGGGGGGGGGRGRGRGGGGGGGGCGGGGWCGGVVGHEFLGVLCKTFIVQ